MEISIIKINCKKRKSHIPIEEVKSRIRIESLRKMEADIYIKTVSKVRTKHEIIVDTELFRKEIIESGRWSDLKEKISDLFVVRN